MHVAAFGSDPRGAGELQAPVPARGVRVHVDADVPVRLDGLRALLTDAGAALAEPRSDRLASIAHMPLRYYNADVHRPRSRSPRSCATLSTNTNRVTAPHTHYDLVLLSVIRTIPCSTLFVHMTPVIDHSHVHSSIVLLQFFWLLNSLIFFYSKLLLCMFFIFQLNQTVLYSSQSFYLGFVFDFV